VLSGGVSSSVRADYVVGCDGGHSAVRRLLGFSFLGETFEEDRGLVGDVELEGLDRDHGHLWSDPERGFLGLTPLPSTDLFQLQAAVSWTSSPSLANFRRIVDEVAGMPGLRIRRATWLSSGRVNVRMVDRYRIGRGLVAGDAAHCHSPAGGQGMNTGIQDAHNLGWKLAGVLRGADESLLDTYEQERLPVARKVLADSENRRRRAASEGVDGLRGLAADQDTSGLTISYRGSRLAVDRPGPGDGLRAGDRAPDAIHRDTGRRLFDLFRGPHWTVLSFGVPSLDEVGAHTIDEAWQAHATYGVDGPAVFVVRPDGYLGLVSRDDAVAPVRQYLRDVAAALTQKGSSGSAR
jgi:flavin-dependent dehydrogenase